MQEELQKKQRDKEEEVKEQRAYLLNTRLYDKLNEIEEKNKEYENFIKNKKINNEKERKMKKDLWKKELLYIMLI